mmetsp:Transcript_11203/g.27484  ORF Transcript_11203/g.27484 Transcript_11203/m.27484 type:complete len:258 (+) Transcript_11203:158-931(+)
MTAVTRCTIAENCLLAPSSMSWYGRHLRMLLASLWQPAARSLDDLAPCIRAHPVARLVAARLAVGRAVRPGAAGLRLGLARQLKLGEPQRARHVLIRVVLAALLALWRQLRLVIIIVILATVGCAWVAGAAVRSDGAHGHVGAAAARAEVGQAAPRLILVRLLLSPDGVHAPQPQLLLLLEHARDLVRHGGHGPPLGRAWPAERRPVLRLARSRGGRTGWVVLPRHHKRGGERLAAREGGRGRPSTHPRRPRLLPLW